MKEEEIKKISWISEVIQIGISILVGVLWHRGFETTVIVIITWMLVSMGARQAKRYGY